MLYFTGIFMLNGKQLLNKADIKNFHKRCLFTLRMISFYKDLTEYGGTLTKIFRNVIQDWHESKNN